MSEQPNPQWGPLKAKLENVRLRARFATEDFVHDKRYKLSVTAERQEQASMMAEVFAGEVMDFIHDNPSAKLKPLQPTREQMSIVYFLLDSVEEGTLTLRETKGRIQESNKGPYIVKIYDAGEPEVERDDLTAELTDLFSRKSATFVVRWDVNRDFPLGFTIFGDVGMTLPKTMDFITLPQKAEKPSQVDEHLGSVDRDDMTTGVYQNGERIILNREAMYQGKQYSMTDQYYLVGSFDGLNSEKTYWVYGKNDDKHHKMSVREGAGAREFATESSKS